MTADNRTIESSDSLKDLDIYCKVREQTALESIVTDWRNFEAGKEFLDYCRNKLPSARIDEALKVSEYSLSDLPEVENVEILEFTQAALNLKKDEFDVLVMSLNDVPTDWQSYEKRAKNDLERLQEDKDSDVANLQDDRDSNLTSLQDSKKSDLSSLQKSQSSDLVLDDLVSARERLESCLQSIEGRKRRLTKLSTSLVTEILFLIGACILGIIIGGYWGATITLIVVLLWRLQS
jgi:hypothetical protein